MSLQMSLIFGMLIFQMSVLLVLLLPLPHVVRNNLVKGSYTIQKSQNIKIGLIVTMTLLGMQFLDCLNRLKKLSGGPVPYFAQSQQPPPALNYDQLASKFYAQRNLYLTGAVLYLCLAIAIVIGVLRKLVKKQNAYTERSEEKPASEDADEIAKYKSLLEKKTIDINALKKQLKNLQSSYDSLTVDVADENKKTD